MKYTKETDLRDFEAWSGGKDTLDRVIELGKCAELEDHISEMFDNPTETEINDFLWFEDEIIAEWLGFDSVDDFYNEGND